MSSEKLVTARVAHNANFGMNVLLGPFPVFELSRDPSEDFINIGEVDDADVAQVERDEWSALALRAPIARSGIGE